LAAVQFSFSSASVQLQFSGNPSDSRTFGIAMHVLTHNLMAVALQA
jgi:hypothetical protein